MCTLKYASVEANAVERHTKARHENQVKCDQCKKYFSNIDSPHTWSATLCYMLPSRNLLAEPLHAMTSCHSHTPHTVTQFFATR